MATTFPDHPTPRALGYRFPAEWEPHQATWLSWPHKEASWPGKIDRIFPVYARFAALLSQGEEVHINVLSSAMAERARDLIEAQGGNMPAVYFHLFPTNDAWVRDHGPAFLIREGKAPRKALVDWGYNAWGGKYPPYELDNEIPRRVAEYRGIPRFQPGINMEGGSIEVNGAGTLLTTRACLLNPNRNPHLSQTDIEAYLCEYYGQEQILWLNDGIDGDDTDGHIDDLTRFVNANTVVTVVESKPDDTNYGLLQENLALLTELRLPDGQPLQIIDLPMPDAVTFQGDRLPASYANFYIGNEVVVVPTFRRDQDQEALKILAGCFPDRKVLGLDSSDIIWGLGSFHCLSQQEPALPDQPA